LNPDGSLVSVVLPVHNGAEFLEQAIKSVLEQTLQEFELIVVDDGSTDATPDVLGRYRDSRIRVLRNPQNVGLVESLNRGIGDATSRLIARVDADDAMLPDRLERQVDYMRANPTCGLLATGYRTMMPNGDLGEESRPFLRHAALRFELLFGNAFAHSTVMFRRALWQDVGGYQDPGGPAEDYDMWLRMSSRTVAAAIPDILCILRVHPASVSAKSLQWQQETAARISSRALTGFLGRSVTQGQILQMMTHTYPGCRDVGEAEKLLLHAQHRVRQECRRRGIPPSGATKAAALKLHSMRYRTMEGRRCYRRLLSLPLRSPTLASSLAATRLEWFWAKHSVRVRG
jgi:hypothetical protein